MWTVQYTIQTLTTPVTLHIIDAFFSPLVEVKLDLRHFFTYGISNLFQTDWLCFRVARKVVIPGVERALIKWL